MAAPNASGDLLQASGRLAMSEMRGRSGGSRTRRDAGCTASQEPEKTGRDMERNVKSWHGKIDKPSETP